ncbi:MAG: hypothetical protein ABSC33_00310 [Candidatus Sulfotelmatobacter sp.]|jgi:hypothetical protein
MGPDHLKFGGGVTHTILNPVVLLLVLVAGVLIYVWPRKKALAVFLVASILIPMDQVLLIGPAHFPMLRLLVLFGIARIVKEKSSTRWRLLSGGLNKIDIALILLTVITAINGILLFQESGAIVYQLGNLYSVFGAYFLLRFLIRDEEDVTFAIRIFAGLTVFIAAIMIYERISGHNPYAFLGGANAAAYANIMERDNKFRATGCFSHPILAGTFGAILVPLFVGLWQKSKKYRAAMAAGIVSSTVMVITCNSSTPMLGYAAGVLALCLWPMRNWMRPVRWGIVITLVLLHIVMKNPVWHLITRIDISGGSSSWHRYMLVDQCIRHFGDWWLVGVQDTSVWGWDMWDTANQYVGTCENSGLIPFILLLAILVYGFKYLGRARRAAGREPKRALFLWALGSALFANVVAFFGISYFDQTIVAWYALLAIISVAATQPQKKKVAHSQPRNAWDSTSLVPQFPAEVVPVGPASEETF